MPFVGFHLMPNNAGLSQGVENHSFWRHARCVVVNASAGSEVRARACIRINVQPADLDGGAAKEAVLFDVRW